MRLDIRYSNHPEDSKKYDTETLRERYLIEKVFEADEACFTYSHQDRIIAGGVMPVEKEVMLGTCKELAAEYFLERREMGAINVGGKGYIVLDGTRYEMNEKDGMYISMGTKEVVFGSYDRKAPAKFYINSCPAHRSYPTVHIPFEKANHVPLGEAETLNKRVINQYVHPAVCESCQLAMGMTVLDPTSVWNTMPCHTHERRMEVYFYFGLQAEDYVVHYFSEDVNFYNMSVFAPKVSPNTDGCDPESCDRVNIIGCRFSVGDDCIAIKSGKLYMGRKYKRPANRHTIRNCLMEYGHGAVVLGSEMSGGVTNLTVNRCLFRQADRGLRIKTRRGRGKDAVIDGVTFEKIKMVDVLTPLVINMYYFCDPDGKTEYVWSRKRLPVDDGTPYLGKFTFRDMECEGVNVACGYFDGLPEMPIKEVELENVSFKIAENAEAGLPAMMSFIAPCRKSGLYFDNVETVKLKNVTFEGVENEEIVTGNVKNYERE